MELPACPVETTLMLIGDKWKVLILRDLMDGTKRFGELKKSIGHVTQKVLTAQLRDMKAKGLITRKVYAEVPPRVEYALSDLGESMRPIMKSMGNRSTEYKNGKLPQQPFPLPKGAKKSSAPAAHCSFLCCKSHFTVTEVMWGLTPSYQ